MPIYLEFPRDGCRPRKGHRTSVLSRNPVEPASAPSTTAAQRSHDEGGGRVVSRVGGGSPEVVVPQVGERHAARRHRVLPCRVDLHLDLGGDRRLGGQLLPVNVERVPDEIQLLR